MKPGCRESGGKRHCDVADKQSAFGNVLCKCYMVGNGSYWSLVHMLSRNGWKVRTQNCMHSQLALIASAV